MLATGWTPAELRAAPARVVRALAWRIFAKTLWDPELAEFARAPVDPMIDAPLETRGRYRLAKQDAQKTLGELEDLLFPEGD